MAAAAAHARFPRHLVRDARLGVLSIISIRDVPQEGMTQGALDKDAHTASPAAVIWAVSPGAV